MKIGSQINAYQARAIQQTQSVDRQEHQVKVLKKALESHEEASTKLLKMLEPKGKNIDIKA